MLSAVFLLTAAGITEHDRVQHRFDAIEEHKVPPGAKLTFTQRELNAWVAVEAPKAVPDGLREPHVELGEGTVTGSALIDFVKVEQSRGKTMNWLMAKLLAGEKPVRVTVDWKSEGGQATAVLKSVEISGTVITGSVLDFLVNNFFQPLFPDARIDQPFPLADGIDRIDIRPRAALVKMKG